MPAIIEQSRHAGPQFIAIIKKHRERSSLINANAGKRVAESAVSVPFRCGWNNCQILPHQQMINDVRPRTFRQKISHEIPAITECDDVRLWIEQSDILRGYLAPLLVRDRGCDPLLPH